MKELRATIVNIFTDSYPHTGKSLPLVWPRLRASRQLETLDIMEAAHLYLPQPAAMYMASLLPPKDVMESKITEYTKMFIVCGTYELLKIYNNTIVAMFAKFNADPGCKNPSLCESSVRPLLFSWIRERLDFDVHFLLSWDALMMKPFATSLSSEEVVCSACLSKLRII